MSGLPMRHRGAHLPDFVRKLDAVGGRAGARVFRQSLVALHHHRRRPAAGSPPASANDFTTIFTNLMVWIDAAVRASAFHAGPAKLQLYVAFLRVLVEELMPDDRLRECVQQINAYVSYLMDAEEEAGAPSASPSRPGVTPSTGSSHAKPTTAYVAVKLPPAPRHQPMAALLSPRVLQQIRRSEPPAAENQSPLRRPTRPTKPLAAQVGSAGKPRALSELSDHEEAVLELALFFQESLEQLVAAHRTGGIGTIDWAARPRAGQSPSVSTKAATPPLLTSKWPQLSAEAKKRALTGVKRRLSRQKFFSSSVPTVKAKPDVSSISSNGGKTGDRRKLVSTEEHLRNDRAVPAPHTKIEPSRYLSIVLLCLHETIRLANVFTQELAQFAWLHLCEEPMEEFERALVAVETQRATALDELQRLRSAKEELQTTIRECETRIQRLQTRNMASVRLWQLEHREAEHFAREEQWHGHCKALMLRSLTQLAKEANLPTWCELEDSTGVNHGGGGSKDGDEVTDAGVVTRSDAAEHGQALTGASSLGDQARVPQAPRPNRLALMGSPRYECLAPGAALLDARLRFQLMYVSHLLILCRSYLHLHERRAARDVVEATATAVATLGAEAEPFDSIANAASAASMTLEVAPDSPPASPTSASHLIARISRHELETLRELSEALRAIEVVYAATMGERPLAVSDVMASSTGHGNRYRLRDSSTQFPEAVEGSIHDGPTSPRAFLRSLAYCTIAATSFTSATAFVPAAIDMTGSYHIASNAATTSTSHAGSGRRRGSAMFKAQGLTLDSSSEQQQQQLVMLRLDQAVHKLPKHMKELLLLLPSSPALPSSVLNGSRDQGNVVAFPFALVSSVTGGGYSIVALSGDELVVRIQAIYSRLAEAASVNTSASASPSWSIPASLSASSQQMTPPLGISLTDLAPSSQQMCLPSEQPDSGALRTPEAIVREIYALFLDAADGAIDLTEREFVRFFASIQLFMSKATSSSAISSSSPAAATSGAARAGGRLAGPACHEVIHLFAILTKLYYLPAPDRSAAFVPRRMFAVVTYCQRVLEQVALDKKRHQAAGGGAFDIWMAASSSSSSSSWSADPPSVFYSADGSSWPSPPTPSTPTSAQKPPTSSLPPQPYVLLDSAKLLLVHVAGISTAPSSVLGLEDSARQLEAHAVAATVSLANATTPAPYQVVCSNSKAASAGHYHQPNGLLTDVQIIPLQVAVAVVARAWLKRIDELQRPLRVAFQAALTTNRVDSIPAGDSNSGDKGCLSFSEFLHVMTNGQPHTLPVRASASSSASSSPWESAASAGGNAELTYSRLVQLYATAVTVDGATRTNNSATDPSALLLGVRWTTLASVVADELDLANALDRFALSDMRSIEHAVVGPAARSGGSGAVAAALQDIAALATSTRQSVLLPWLLRPPYTCPSDMEGSTSATVAALRKSWAAHRSSMSERFAGAAQADGSAIDGVLSWQIGQQRFRLVDKLLPHHQDVPAISYSDGRKRTVKCDSDGGATMPADVSGTGAAVGASSEANSSRKPTAVAPAMEHEKLSDEQVGVMWTSFYYLQLRHARAHQLVEVADRAANKQQQPARLQKTNTAVKTAGGTPSSTAPAGPTTATSPVLK